jgi:hypothetical protein
MCVPLPNTKAVSTATWVNFFPAIKKDGTAVYVYKILQKESDAPDAQKKGSTIYKMVDYSSLRIFFTGKLKKFPESSKPDDNVYHYKDGELGDVRFVYWTELFERERQKEQLNRQLKRKQKMEAKEAPKHIDASEEEQEEEEEKVNEDEENDEGTQPEKKSPASRKKKTTGQTPSESTRGTKRKRSSPVSSPKGGKDSKSEVEYENNESLEASPQKKRKTNSGATRTENHGKQQQKTTTKTKEIIENSSDETILSLTEHCLALMKEEPKLCRDLVAEMGDILQFNKSLLTRGISDAQLFKTISRVVNEKKGNHKGKKVDQDTRQTAETFCVLLTVCITMQDKHDEESHEESS